MVSTRKKRQSNKRLLSQLDDFDQDIIIGNATSDRQENVVANEVLMTEILPVMLLMLVRLLIKMR